MMAKISSCSCIFTLLGTLAFGFLLAILVQHYCPRERGRECITVYPGTCTLTNTLTIMRNARVC